LPFDHLAGNVSLSTIDGHTVTTLRPRRPRPQVSLAAIANGAAIYKYGQIIGLSAARPSRQGITFHVTT